MKGRWLVVPAVVGMLAIPGAAQAAEEPCGDPNFGRHVSSMAQKHAKAHGHEFGHCVAAMARKECPECA